MTGQLALAFPDPIPMVEAHHLHGRLPAERALRSALLRRSAVPRPIDTVHVTLAGVL